MYFAIESYQVNEEAGSVSICVESGVTGAFQAVLTVTLSALDGKASELQYYVYVLCFAYLHPHWLINLYIRH